MISSACVFKFSESNTRYIGAKNSETGEFSPTKFPSLSETSCYNAFLEKLPYTNCGQEGGELQVTIAVLQFLTFNAVGTEMVLRGPHSGGLFARPTCGQEPWHGHGVTPIS